jgi:Zn-dependent metalloprotease
MCNCSHPNRHHPLNCVIPPYMLEQIAQNGTPQQQAWARQTMAVTATFRQERIALASGGGPGGAVPMAPAAVSAVKQRYVYSANFGTTLPGQLLRQEGGPPASDPAANEAYDGAGSTFDLYWNTYQRNSIDNQGMSLVSTVHYDRGYDNAFWNGQQMVYGDGDEDLPPDQRLFNRFTIAIDVIGHELTHGVTQNEANLVYSGQSGALNESWSDVFGSLVKQYSLNQTARSADWIIGAGLFTSNVQGVGIRSMKAPGSAYDDPVLGKDPQPANMSGYVNTSQDNGGVHINSGIPNRAFYVTAYELDGYAWEKAGKIWYATLTGGLSSTASFQEAANATYQTAGTLFGPNSVEQQAVQNGWAAVGISVAASTTTTNPGCFASLISLFRPTTMKK